jgi:hypothetical protein
MAGASAVPAFRDGSVTSARHANSEWEALRGSNPIGEDNGMLIISRFGKLFVRIAAPHGLYQRTT